MAEVPIPSGFAVPLVDLTTFRLPPKTMAAIQADTPVASSVAVGTTPPNDTTPGVFYIQKVV